MRKLIFSLGILYLLQTIMILPTCFIEIRSDIIRSKDIAKSMEQSQDDSFGAGIEAAGGRIVPWLVFLVFLWFFVFSLRTAALLLRGKSTRSCIASAVLGCLPPVLFAWVLWNRLDFVWILYPGTEILFCLVTIIVVASNLPPRPAPGLLSTKGGG